jgi:hypothetical protein
METDLRSGTKETKSLEAEFTQANCGWKIYKRKKRRR